MLILTHNQKAEHELDNSQCRHVAEGQTYLFHRIGFRQHIRGSAVIRHVAPSCRNQLPTNLVSPSSGRESVFGMDRKDYGIGYFILDLKLYLKFK